MPSDDNLVIVRKAMQSIPAPRGALFSGHLSHFSLPDTLEFLHAGQRTGTLLCGSVRGVGAIYVRKGTISGAASPKMAPLGQLLVARGTVTAADAEAVAQLQHSLRLAPPIGALMVSRGCCTATDVGDSLKSQISSAVCEIVQWGDGQFVFESEPEGASRNEQIEVSVDPLVLLHDISRDDAPRKHA
jgi:hypothetical protein